MNLDRLERVEAVDFYARGEGRGVKGQMNANIMKVMKVGC